jgi:SAM-dependent methyltransferase
MDWKILWTVRTIGCFTPFVGHFRTIKRNISPFPTENVSYTLDSGLEFIEMLRAADFNIDGSVVVEIGTGWVPVLPILFYLCGANEITTVDKHKLLEEKTVRQCLSFFKNNITIISKRLLIDESVIRHKLDNIEGKGLVNLLSAFHCRYESPSDAQSMTKQDNSTDLVYSHAVLEHIPPEIITGILAESRRILKPGGITAHMIDNSDHWAHKDKKISYINFLKFEDWAWNIISINGIDYQNRLRNHDYLNLLKDSGFKIIHDHPFLEPLAMPAFSTLKLAGKYAGFTKEQLARCRSNIIGGIVK